MASGLPLLKDKQAFSWSWLEGDLGGAALRITHRFKGDPAQQQQDFLHWLAAREAAPRFLEQIHSAMILDPDETDRNDPPQGDAWVTRGGEVLGIRTADCGPVALVEAEAGIRGLVHSGWRGTEQGILPKALEAVSRLGGDPTHLKAFLGPLMRGCCYEVGDEVGFKFVDQFPGSYEPLAQGKGMLSLEKVLHAQLKEAGVEKIIDSGWCTGCGGMAFHSYRREGEKAGRTLTLLGPIQNRI